MPIIEAKTKEFAPNLSASQIDKLMEIATGEKQKRTSSKQKSFDRFAKAIGSEEEALEIVNQSSLEMAEGALDAVLHSAEATECGSPILPVSVDWLRAKADRQPTLRGQKLSVVGKSQAANPFREGTKSHKAFEIVRANDGATFDELKALGARARTITECVRIGYIRTL